MLHGLASPDLSQAVTYHYGEFQPRELDHSRLIKPLTAATAALARYDQMLKGMHNSEIMLAPLRNQEAVMSSRMEGTITTLDELLELEAATDDQTDLFGGSVRNEAIEVLMYQRAMKRTQAAIEDGMPISEHMIRSAHQVLLGFGNGRSKQPGAYKTEQNYLADRIRGEIRFVPIAPEHLPAGMQNLVAFMNDEEPDPLIQTALSHIEFEALHPFKDGNGRIGRMLITLMLWKRGVISAPHFYASGYLETVRESYIEHMRDVSRSGAWTEWCIFFFEALERQATANLETTETIRALYEDMQIRFRKVLGSQWHVAALNYMFSRPIFRTGQFRAGSGIPEGTANRIVRILIESDILRVIVPASGRRPATISFEPLMQILRV